MQIEKEEFSLFKISNLLIYSKEGKRIAKRFDIWILILNIRHPRHELDEKEIVERNKNINIATNLQIKYRNNKKIRCFMSHYLFTSYSVISDSESLYLALGILSIISMIIFS